MINDILAYLMELHELFAMEYAPDLDECLEERLQWIERLKQAEIEEYEKLKNSRKVLDNPSNHGIIKIQSKKGTSAMFKSIEEYLGIEFPKGLIKGSWFAEHNLPIIVSCTCCGATMALPFALVDEDGYPYCRSCAGND